jgi:pullulanase/glycogen debranching enzyme
VQAAQGRLAGTGIGTFSDRGRDAVRGGGCCDGGPEQVTRQGWASGLHTAPNEAVQALLAAPGAGPAAEYGAPALQRTADLVRVALAGTLRDFSFQTASGEVREAGRIDYAGQPAGYAREPGEVVNYTENHDNATLWDVLALKLPLATPAAERARVQHVANAVVALSQGIAYFHAGQEMLRSKSMDRNSYDSGDWFNRLDWTFTDNGFGAGLPPRQDNEGSWPLMAPRLADPRLKPAPADITWTRDAFLDLLKVRTSTTLLRLRTARDVKERLTLLAIGPTQSGSVVGAHIDGRRYPGAGFDGLTFLINAAPVAQQVAAPALRGQRWQLHPVLLSPQAADRRAAEAAWDADTATFTVPPRTAVVWVTSTTAP